MHRRGHQRDTAHHYRQAAPGALRLKFAPLLDLCGAALLLDVDGTLLDFENDPDEVVADAELLDILYELNRYLGGALALVSGRSVASLDRLFKPHRFAVSGTHGAEVRWQDGRRYASPRGRLPTTVVEALDAFCARAPGVTVEKKEHGVALHYRLAPEMAASCRRFMEEQMRALGDAYRLVCGKMVFEIVAATHDKGTGVLSLLEDGVFVRRRPVFVGDDEPDESAFRAVNELGGLSVRVGRREASAARYFLDDVVSVRAWLQQGLTAATRPIAL